MRETIQNANGKQFHAVSLSGGKDSTAMLLLMIERDMPIDMVLSADTGMEFPEMYEHLAKLDEHLFRERGIHITPTFGAAAVPPPRLTVRASSVGSSIIPVGMWADWARRDFATSVRLYPLLTSNRAIWCFSPEPTTPPVSAMWVSTSATI